MRSPALLLGLVLTYGTTAAADPPREETGFVPLFDGKSFQGWEGNLRAFRIEEGAIVGGSLENRVPANEYLCTEKEFADFELRLKFRILGTDPNAGIQIRSERVPDSTEMIGYQADIGQTYWGCLYDERRHKLLTGPTADDQQRFANRTDWNDYVIRCQGRRIDLWLNGHHTVGYTEPDPGIPQTGVIGLQIHSGEPSEAWYKDIRIKAIAAEPKSTAVNYAKPFEPPETVTLIPYACTKFRISMFPITERAWRVSRAE